MIIILAFCGAKQGKLPIHNGNSYQPARSCQYLHHPLTLELAIQGLKFPFIKLFLCFLFGTSLLPPNFFAITNPFTFGSTPRTSQLCTHKRSFHKNCITIRWSDHPNSTRVRGYEAVKPHNFRKRPRADGDDH